MIKMFAVFVKNIAISHTLNVIHALNNVVALILPLALALNKMSLYLFDSLKR